MVDKRVPLRKCVVSHEKLHKKSLYRIVRTPEGKVIIDDTSKANGRGAYLKKDKDVIEKARKTKILDKNLETEVPNTIYDELLEKLEEEKEND